MSPHLLSIQQLSRVDINRLLDRAVQLLATAIEPQCIVPSLSGQIVANLFFEPSTRTRQSFVIAAKRLDAIVLNPAMEQSATRKGESLQDTLQTYLAMGCRCFVVRDARDYFAEKVAKLVGDQAAVINGGDGCHQHPTQTLLDLLTIRQHKADFSGLTVAIVGDLAHSRVAGSLIPGLALMGVTSIRLVAPDNWLPRNVDSLPVTTFNEMTSGIADADVVVMLRIQRERMMSEILPKNDDYAQCYGLSQAQLCHAKSDAIVMHPGPINRGVEIAADVADGPQSVIIQQVKNGVAVRMAVLEWLLADGCAPKPI